MIGTIRKHQKWLWAVIITVTILSFVVFFSPDTNKLGFSGGDKKAYIHGQPVTIGGEPIMRDEFEASWKETVLGSFMRTGGREWPGNDEQTQENLRRDAVTRIFLIKKMKEMGVHVSDMAIAYAAHDRLGGFPPASFEKEYLQPRGFTFADFERFLKNEIGIQQLMSAAAVSAKLYNPKEAESIFRKQHEQNDTRVAVFWASNYLDKITVNPQDLTGYFTTNAANYRLPDRVVVKYLEFSATNYLAEADSEIAKITNFNARVEEAYLKAGTNTFKDTNGVALSEADAKKKIKEEFREGTALAKAFKQANEIGNELYNLRPETGPENPENLDKVAVTNKLTVKTSPPLERMADDEEEAAFSQAFRSRAFSLNATNPISYSPVRGERAIYILALKTNIPSESQPFEKVKDKVTADYKEFRARDMAWRDGTNFYAVVTNRLAQKESFEAICTQAKVQFITPPKFSTATPSLTNLDERISFESIPFPYNPNREIKGLKAIAGDLKPGQVSHFTPSPLRAPVGGFVVYLKDRTPVDEETVKKDFPEFLARMRNYRQYEVFNAWFRKQVEQTKIYIAPANASVTSGG